MVYVDEVSDMFNAESEKLEGLINDAAIKPKLTVHEIIETYYQIMNVSSITVMLRQQLHADKHKILLDKISKIENLIDEMFNSSIHPKIMDYLANSIQGTMTRLASEDTKNNSKEIEDMAKHYEELRQKMSTMEFVKQYDAGISND